VKRHHASLETPPTLEHVTVRRSRLVTKDVAADYLSTSINTIERLIYSGELPIVKLPVARGPSGKGIPGESRRVLIDVADLDALIRRSKVKEKEPR
jgi:hypothetical protein